MIYICLSINTIYKFGKRHIPLTLNVHLSVAEIFSKLDVIWCQEFSHSRFNDVFADVSFLVCRNCCLET